MIGDYGRPHTWTVHFYDGETIECAKLRKLLWTMRPRLIPWSWRRRWHRLVDVFVSDERCNACDRRERLWRRLHVIGPGYLWCGDRFCRLVITDRILDSMSLEDLERMTDREFAEFLGLRS